MLRNLGCKEIEPPVITISLYNTLGNITLEEADISVMREKLHQITTKVPLTPIMKDVLDFVYKNADKDQILDYLSTSYKDFSDIKDESARIVKGYIHMIEKNGSLNNRDKRILQYLKTLLEVSDSDLEQINATDIQGQPSAIEIQPENEIINSELKNKIDEAKFYTVFTSPSLEYTLKMTYKENPNVEEIRNYYLTNPDRGEGEDEFEKEIAIDFIYEFAKSDLVDNNLSEKSKREIHFLKQCLAIEDGDVLRYAELKKRDLNLAEMIEACHGDR